MKIEFNLLVLCIIVAIIIIFLLPSPSRERFSSFYGDPGNCSNDLHPYAAVPGATPWSVVPPSWIGRLDQGNGLIGDDALSGFSFSPAM